MSDSMQEFASQCKKAWELKAQIEELDRPVAIKKKELEELKRNIMKTMEASNKKTEHIEGMGYGKITRVMVTSARVPKTVEDKKAMLDWICEKKGEDIMLALVSVKSKELNTFFKDELPDQVAGGEDPDWVIPGMQETAVSHRFMFTANK